MSSSKRSLSPSAIMRGARVKRLRESSDTLEDEIIERMREIADLEMKKALVAVADVDLQETRRQLAEEEQEFNGIYDSGTKNRTMASLTALDGGPSQLEAPKEESELKMNKLAATSAANTCTLCNVVCNSKTVFISHLAGRKHAAMVKKKTEAEV